MAARTEVSRARTWTRALFRVPDAPDMPRALRLSGGLRLVLDGQRATTRVPVLCCVKMGSGSNSRWTFTMLFYNDELRRTAAGWRIVSRYEELVFPEGGEPPGLA